MTLDLATRIQSIPPPPNSPQKFEAHELCIHDIYSYLYHAKKMCAYPHYYSRLEPLANDILYHEYDEYDSNYFKYYTINDYYKYLKKPQLHSSVAHTDYLVYILPFVNFEKENKKHD